MILKEIKNIFFFDGINNQNCQMKNEYWLGSADAEKYLTAGISFINETEEVTIKLFEPSQNTFRKNLSDWQAPKKGFFKDDLLKLAENLKFKLLKNENGNEEGYSLGYPLQLIIKNEKNRLYFLIYAINGSRAAESIYFFGLYEVFIDDNRFKNQYFIQ